MAENTGEKPQGFGEKVNQAADYRAHEQPESQAPQVPTSVAPEASLPKDQLIMPNLLPPSRTLEETMRILDSEGPTAEERARQTQEAGTAIRKAFLDSKLPGSEEPPQGFGEKVDNAAAYRARQQSEGQTPQIPVPEDGLQGFAAEHTSKALDVLHKLAGTTGAGETNPSPTKPAVPGNNQSPSK